MCWISVLNQASNPSPVRADVSTISNAGPTLRMFAYAASRSNSTARARSDLVMTAMSAELKIVGGLSD
jgi:hypothetical protein